MLLLFVQLLFRCHKDETPAAVTVQLVDFVNHMLNMLQVKYINFVSFV